MFEEGSDCSIVQLIGSTPQEYRSRLAFPPPPAWAAQGVLSFLATRSRGMCGSERLHSIPGRWCALKGTVKSLRRFFSAV